MAGFDGLSQRKRALSRRAGFEGLSQRKRALSPRAGFDGLSHRKDRREVRERRRLGHGAAVGASGFGWCWGEVRDQGLVVDIA
jgi:hypothetical protein